MSNIYMVEGNDEVTKRQEIIDAMDQAFLQDLARAGANVPPRSTVTTALLRGLLWDKREDELLTKGHTSIETQVVKNSRRSALMQLVSQVWKVPKPEYDKVDAILSASLNDTLRISSSQFARSTPSPSLDSIEANGSRTRSSLGSSAEYDAYEALSSLSDAMAVDEPTLPHSASWTTDDSTTEQARDDRHLETPRDPIDTITSVVFRSSPQLTSIKFARAREMKEEQGQQPIAQVPFFGNLIQSQNRFSKSHRSSFSSTGSSGSKYSINVAGGKSTASHHSPRSPVSSPSSSGLIPPISALQGDRDSRMSIDKSFSSDSQASRSRFPLPIDLKSLIKDPATSQSSSANSEESPLSTDGSLSSIRSTSARTTSSSSASSASSAASGRGPVTPTTQFGWSTSPVLPHSQPQQPDVPATSVSPIPAIKPLFGAAVPISADPRGMPLTPALLGSGSFASPADHVPVWVPRSNPLIPLILCPVRSAQGEWFYTYQAISYSDMNALINGVIGGVAQGSHLSSPTQPH